MTTTELQNFLHVYCMFDFQDGHNEPGILINKYNIAELQVEYYFIAHKDMNEYKDAFDNFDMSTCGRLSQKIETDEIISVHPVSLKDYKALMQQTSLTTNRVNLNS